MKLIYTFILILLFTNFVVAKSAIENPVNADIVVATDGTGDFTSLQEAINVTPANSDRRTVIYIKRGLYNTEKLIVAGDKINLTLIGESREETVISYHIYDCSQGKCPVDDAALWTGDNIRTSATLTIHGDGFRAENLTIQNTAGPVGQAQAVTIRADKCVFINVDFYSYQDTMYFWSEGNRSYFEGCLVVGRTDYIYGGAIVYFQECEIRSWGGGWITAPSTPKSQAYGFVFNECDITYDINSPRGGDDGELIRFGRPWHNYPKVTWLNCEMTDKIHPQGWGDKWNMDYSNTSADLHLYEYNNTGTGADMTGRADWAGIKSLTDEEAEEYTVQKVMAGNDGWDPTAEAPLIKSYTWNDNGTSSGWLVPENWNPAGVPANGESAVVDSAFTINASDTFLADLSFKNGAKLNVVANSFASYISVEDAEINTSESVSLAGKIATKGTITFNIEGTLTLNSPISGVHDLFKTGAGTTILNADNNNFSGAVNVESGTLEAAVSGALGKGAIKVSSGAKLTIGHDNAFYAKSKLEIIDGANLELNADVTTSEFFIDGVMQAIGEYTSATHPDLINGSGKIIIGRPEKFVFHRGSNGNWDNPEHYTPALLPLAGETVICEEEMETTSTVFAADLIIQGAGKLRLRGDPSKNHTSTGKIYMEEGTSIKYNTGGTGMYIKAAIVINGNVTTYMESGNASGSTMTLAGPISGNATVSVINNGKGTPNDGTLLLSDNNVAFKGTWDVSKNSEKYPTSTNYISKIEGSSENAFGKGSIVAGLNNRVIFSHSKAAGDSLVLTLNESAKAVLDVDVVVDKYYLNGSPVDAGVYSSATNPELYEGTGHIFVGENGTEPPVTEDLPAFPGAEGHGKYVTGGRGGRVIYVTNLEDNSSVGSLRYAVNQTGARIILFKVSGTIQLKSRLSITKGDVTIAGQTAPGDGITIRDYPVTVGADNVILRFLRFRMGDKTAQEADAIGGRFQKNIIVDHCSMSWSTDECVSFYNNENFSLQWSIISESLRNSVHDKGSHGYGGIWGGKNASFHHNVLAHHDSRNPRLGESKGSIFALTDLVDLRNNVIYNWKGNSCYGGEAMNANIVNCYYKPGPATTKKERIIAIDKLLEPGYPISDMWGKFYIDGNVLTGSIRATNDNWTYGVYNQYNAKYDVSDAEREAMRMAEAFNPGEVTTHLAEIAYEKILQFGGASLVKDSVDIRIMRDLATGTATYMDGGNGSKNGIVDTQDAVGGWPMLESEEAPTDADKDGMPDNWEDANGLNPEDPSDAQLKTVDGVYPNIEVYINGLVHDIITEQNKDDITSAVNEIKIDKQDIRLYFNHSMQELNINHNEIINSVNVYSVTGTLLINKKFNSSAVQLSIPRLNDGIYIVRVMDEQGQVFSKKVPIF